MTDGFLQLVDEAIQLELNVAELYLLFSNVFSQDASFWWELAVEEKNHASLIKSGLKDFYPLALFPRDLVGRKLEELKRSNQRVLSLLKQYQKTPPDREEAFNVALAIEQSAGEIHFQRFMEKEPESEVERIFQELGQDDLNHIERIQAYMSSFDLQPNPR